MTRTSTKVVSFLAAFALAAAAGASARNSETITLGHDATVGGAPLAAGQYVVSWKTHTPDATVTFQSLHGNQVVAKAQGRFEKRNTVFDQDAVVYLEAPDGSRKLVEIRMAGTNKALVFTPASHTGGTGTNAGAAGMTKGLPSNGSDLGNTGLLSLPLRAPNSAIEPQAARPVNRL